VINFLGFVFLSGVKSMRTEILQRCCSLVLHYDFFFIIFMSQSSASSWKITPMLFWIMVRRSRRRAHRQLRCGPLHLIWNSLIHLDRTSSIMVRLWAVRPRDQGSFSDWGESFVSPPQLPDQFWGLPRLLFSGHRWYSEYETNHSSSIGAKGKHKLVYGSTSTEPSWLGA